MVKTKIYNLKTRQIVANVSGDLFWAALKMDGCVVVEFDTKTDIKALFRAYNSIAESRDYLQKKYDEAQSKISYIGAAVSDGMPHGSGTSDPVLRKAELLLQQDANTAKLKVDLARVKNDLLVCDILLDQLTTEERKVIEYYYIKGKGWKEIAGIIHRSRMQCYREHNVALKKMVAFLLLH